MTGIARCKLNRQAAIATLTLLTRCRTFLKRKGGLFKKAHELSVLCSVDVAVFIFGNNKKLYEYSSSDMHDLITRYQYVRHIPQLPRVCRSYDTNWEQHGGANEHKGPADFNGGNDDDEDEEGDGSPPQGDILEQHQMLPPQYHGQPAAFPQIRHHTPSASPPIGNGVAFGHPGQPQRGHTPQPPNMGSRPSSRNDRRGGPNVVQQPHPGVQGVAYMPTPPIYNPNGTPGQQAQHYPYPPPPPPQQQQPPPQQQQQQMPPPHQQQHQEHPHQQHSHPYLEERMAPPPLNYSQAPAPQGLGVVPRPEPSPPMPQGHLQPPHHNIPRISVSPQPERRLSEPQPPPPPPPVQIKSEGQGMARQPPLPKTEAAIKKLPQRKSHSIFTPIEESRSVLSQHLASFQPSDPSKSDSGASIAAAAAANREAAKARAGNSTSPPLPHRTSSQGSIGRDREPNAAFPPPARSNTGGSTRPRGPPLTLQIPADEASEAGGSASAAGESSSPRPPDSATHAAYRHNSHSSVVLPPPSPSASAVLSAGATGPPNPFARPPPQQGVNGETPASALPSRFINHDFLPSPNTSSFYQEWGFRGNDSNTVASPLNFSTPLTGAGPSFLRDDTGGSSASNTAAPSTTGGSSAGTTASSTMTATLGPSKRKSPEVATPSQETNTDPKRLKTIP